MSSTTTLVVQVLRARNERLSPSIRLEGPQSELAVYRYSDGTKRLLNFKCSCAVFPPELINLAPNVIVFLDGSRIDLQYNERI